MHACAYVLPFLSEGYWVVDKRTKNRCVYMCVWALTNLIIVFEFNTLMLASTSMQPSIIIHCGS